MIVVDSYCRQNGRPTATLCMKDGRKMGSGAETPMFIGCVADCKSAYSGSTPLPTSNFQVFGVCTITETPSGMTVTV